MPKLPFRVRALAAAVLLLLGSGYLHATTVVAPSFPELVAEADTIVRARVVEVRAAWADTPQGRIIKTFVTFAVEKQLKGRGAGAQLTLSFLGGDLDGESMRVEGMPRFTAGQREILFVSGNGTRFCPLVAMMHGRYHVLTDPATSRDYIARNDGVPLVSEGDVQLPQPGNVLERRTKTVSAALSPAAFESRIVSEITRRAQP